MVATRQALSSIDSPINLDGCVLNAPLWHEKLKKDAANQIAFLPPHGVGSGRYGSASGTMAQASQGLVFNAAADEFVLICSTPSAGMQLLAGLLQLTILAWVNPTDYSTNQSIIGEFNAEATMAAMLRLLDVAATSTCQVAGDIKDDAGVRNELDGLTTTIPYGQFSFIGMTWDNVTQRVFLNAVEDNSVAYSGTKLETTTINTALGRYNVTLAAQELNGTLGAIWVFNRALSIWEIKHIYEVTKGRFI